MLNGIANRRHSFFGISVEYECYDINQLYQSVKLSALYYSPSVLSKRFLSIPDI